MLGHDGFFFGSPKLSSKASTRKVVAATSCYTSCRDKVLMCLASACIVTVRDFLLHFGTEQTMTVVESFFGNQEIQVMV